MALRRLVEVLLFCAFVAVIVAVTASRAYAQEGTPTVGPPPTPPAGAPLPPTELFAAFGTHLTWIDNSDNEDGFRITRRVFGGVAPDRTDTYEVGADVTSFSLPDDAPRLCAEGGYQAFDLTLVAFNDAGASAQETYGVLTECNLTPATPAAPDATPTVETTTLPATGTGLRSASPLYMLTLVASFAATTVVLALAIRAAGGRR